MAQVGAGPVAANFAANLDELFLDTPDPRTGKPYSNRQVAEALRRAGHEMSHTQLGKLRRGTAQPRLTDVEELARFFDVPVTYFTQDVDDVAATITTTRRLQKALSNPAIENIAMRLAGAGLSEEGIKAVENMIARVIQLEQNGGASAGAGVATQLATAAVEAMLNQVVIREDPAASASAANSAPRPDTPRSTPARNSVQIEFSERPRHDHPSGSHVS